MKRIVIISFVFLSILLLPKAALAIYNNNVANWLTMDPECQITAPFETYQDEWFTVSAWGSSAFAFKSIDTVNFSTDSQINGGVDGAWDSRGPFGWETDYDDPITLPDPDWESSNKVMSFSFSELGNHEIFAQITDNFGYTDQCYGVINILVPPNATPTKPEIPEAYKPSGTVWSGECQYSMPIPAFYWTYVDEDNVPTGTDPQSAYQIRIGDDSNFETEENGDPIKEKDEYTCDGQICLAESQSPSFAPQPSSWISWADFEETYYWTVRVKDSKEAWSEWSDPTAFSSPVHSCPNPDFTHSPQEPSQGEEVEFEDLSLCYDSRNREYECNNNESVRYVWDFGDGEICDSNESSVCRGSVTHTYSTVAEYTVTLTVTDDAGTCQSLGDTPISTSSSLPQWQEVPPILFFHKFMADIMGPFKNLLFFIK